MSPVSGRRLRPVLSLVALFALAVALLAPLVSSPGPASAQPLCLGETVWDPALQQCVPADASVPPSVAAVPSTPPSLEPVPSTSAPPAADPTVSPSVGDTDPPPSPSSGEAALTSGTTFINFSSAVRTCRNDRDWYGVADFAPFNPIDCFGDQPGEVAFQIFVDGTLFTATTLPDEPSADAIGASNLPEGTITIREAIPDGYGVPIVYCFTQVVWITGAPYPPPPGRAMQRYFASDDGAIEIPNVRIGEQIYCQWFNIPTDASAAILIRAFECPAGYDAAGVPPATLRATCPYVQDNRTFNAARLSDTVMSGDTADDAGNVRFERLLPGTWRIFGLQPNTYGSPIVYCELLGPDDQTLREYDLQLNVGQGYLDHPLATLETLRCDWFFLPDSNGNRNAPPDACAPAAPEASPSGGLDGLGIRIGDVLVPCPSPSPSAA